MKILLSILFLFSILNFNAQELTRILFILDASNSMNAKWTMDQTRIQAAKELLAKEIDGLIGTPNLEVAGSYPCCGRVASIQLARSGSRTAKPEP